MASLKALILTCSSLYHAFLEVEPLILAKILQKEINPELMHDALATLQSSQIVPWNRMIARNLLMLYTTGQTSSLLPTWDLRKALVVSELQGHVQFFADRFASSALSKSPVTGLPETDPPPVSPSELMRIQRTFYRFELYRNLFVERRRGCGDYFGPLNADYQGRYLDGGFTPWEHEQRACIHDYLVEALLTSFNDRANHAVLRGLHRAILGKEWSREDLQDYLSLGLARLHQIILAKTHSQRKHLLSSPSLTSKDFVDDGLSSQDTPGNTSRSGLTEEQGRNLTTPHLPDDDDPGPRDAWHWAHADSSPAAGWYNTEERDDLRQRGYVMWDSARLAGWKVLDVDWRSLPRPLEEERYWDWVCRPDADRMPNRTRGQGVGWVSK